MLHDQTKSPSHITRGECSTNRLNPLSHITGGGPRVVVSTAAFHARVRGLKPDSFHFLSHITWSKCSTIRLKPLTDMGGGPRVVVSTAAFHARVRGSVPGLGGLKETKLFLPHPRVKVSIVGRLRDREVACSTSDRQGSNFESCVWRTVSSHSSHHLQEVILAQFSLYVHKGGLKPHSFHFLSHITRASAPRSD